MGSVLDQIEELVSLEYEIGVLLGKIQYARRTQLIIQIDDSVVSTNEYVLFLEKRIVEKEKRLENLIQVLLESTLDTLEMVRQMILQLPNGTEKSEKLWVIYNLIKLKYKKMEEMIL